MKDNLLAEEIETYEKHKSELLKEHSGEYVLIRGNEVVNTFESQKDAIKIGIEKFGNTPFLVKKILEVDEKQNFTSNLIKISAPCLR
ncbi:MAG: hypothetical protein KJ600_05230 [Nanoarchaeota archaeon]|nr:hypothetical protein [Nanoarchaeota archaeon]MBU1103932.1 hypothetical protein [Nanoarchaeota archaeon]